MEDRIKETTKKCCIKKERNRKEVKRNARQNKKNQYTSIKVAGEDCESERTAMLKNMDTFCRN